MLPKAPAVPEVGINLAETIKKDGQPIQQFILGQTVVNPFAVAAVFHDAGGLQPRQVPGYRRLRHFENSHQITNSERSAPQQHNNTQASRLRQAFQ